MKFQCLKRYGLQVSILSLGVFTACDVERTRDPEAQILPYDLSGIARIQAVEVMRIGSVDDPDYGFSSIGRVAEDDDQNIIVVESQSLEVRKYDQAGRLVWTAGGRGDGPGEFRSAPAVGVVGDTIWAHDSQGRRLTLLSSDGIVISARQYSLIPQALHPIPPAAGVRSTPLNGVLVPLAMRPDGNFVTVLDDRHGITPHGPIPGASDTIRIPRLALDATGEVVDTLGWDVRLPFEPVRVSIVQEGVHQFIVPQAPPTTPFRISLVDGNLVIEQAVPASEDDATFKITRLDLQGAVVFSNVYSYVPRAYPDEWLDFEASRVATVAGGGMVVAEHIILGTRLDGPNVPPSSDEERTRWTSAIRDAMRFPAYQLPVERSPGQHHIGADGGVWLRREYEGIGTVVRWLILDPLGMPLGELEVPSSRSIRWSKNNIAWFVERDALGVPWLVKYRLEL